MGVGGRDATSEGVGLRLLVVGALLLVLTGAVASQLWLLASGGPRHFDATIEGRIPATVYPPPERAPVVVLAHGFSSDRTEVSALARGLADAGYGVVTFDFAGHGANRDAFAFTDRRDILGVTAGSQADLHSVVDWAAANELLDGDNLALVGHSMGAGAAFRFSTQDLRCDAVVLVAGGFELGSGSRPRNLLVLTAANDLAYVRDTSRMIATAIAGQRVLDGITVGDVTAGTAVRAVQVAAANHLTISRSPITYGEIVGWLDGTFDVTRDGLPPWSDFRRQLGYVYLAALAMVGVWCGVAVGRATPRTLRGEPGSRRYPAIAGSLAISLVLSAVVRPGRLLRWPIMGEVVSLIGIAGGVLFLMTRSRADLPSFSIRWLGTTARRAAIATAVICPLLVPIGWWGLHRLIPTPERLALAAVAFALCFPFALITERLLRGGGPLASTGRVILSRLMLIAALAVAGLIGVVPIVVTAISVYLVLPFLIVEVFAMPAYRAGADPRVIAVVETVLLSWLAANWLPVGW